MVVRPCRLGTRSAPARGWRTMLNAASTVATTKMSSQFGLSELSRTIARVTVGLGWTRAMAVVFQAGSHGASSATIGPGTAKATWAAVTRGAAALHQVAENAVDGRVELTEVLGERDVGEVRGLHAQAVGTGVRLVVVTRSAEHRSELPRSAHRQVEGVDEVSVVAGEDGPSCAGDPDAARCHGHGGNTELAAQRAGLRADVDEHRAGVHALAGDGRAPGAAAHIAGPFEDLYRTSGVGQAQSSREAGGSGTDDGDIDRVGHGSRLRSRGRPDGSVQGGGARGPCRGSPGCEVRAPCRRSGRACPVRRCGPGP